MADLKENTTIGGREIWSASNLPLLVKPDTLEYKGFKVYTESSKPTPTELGIYSKLESDNLLNNKVDKVLNKGLSERDFTSVYETKLNGIEDGSQKNVATNLVFLTTATEGSLQSTTGNTITIAQVSTTKAGLISASDKVKLDSLPSGNSGVIPLSAGGTGATTPATARTALQLGNAATHNYGTVVNTIAQGNDSRIVNAASVTQLNTGLALKADKLISINTSNGIVGGGDLSANRTLSLTYGTAVNTVAQGNDSRINNGQSAFDRLDIGATAATARTALQLGNAATHNYGTTNNSIMQGNDSRVVNAASVTQLNSGLALKADKTINIIAGTGLSGGGDLSANRTISVDFGTTSGKVAQGNDSRINNGQSAFDRLDIGATAATARTALQLGNAATRNVGLETGNLLEVGAFGIGEKNVESLPASGFGYNSFFGGNVIAINSTGEYGSLLVMAENGAAIASNKSGVAWSAEIWHKKNLLDIGTTAATARTALELNNIDLAKLRLLLDQITMTGTTVEFGANISAEDVQIRKIV